MKPQSRYLTTRGLVDQFMAGLTIHKLAERYNLPVLKVEQAIRRWMLVYPDGQPKKKP